MESSMKTGLIPFLGVTLAIAACTSTTSNTSGQASEAVVSSDASSPAAAESTSPNFSDYQEVIVPSGTILSLLLMTPLASDTSAVAEPVRAELEEAVAVDGRDVLAVGTEVEGYVTDVDRSGRVTGRATIAFRLTTISVGGERYELQAAPVSEMAPPTRDEDARMVGVRAGDGALIGELLREADGAAKDAAVGGGAGTGVVLAARDKEVRLGVGAPILTELTSALMVLVPGE